jgi:hypothetical protein
MLSRYCAAIGVGKASDASAWGLVPLGRAI